MFMERLGGVWEGLLLWRGLSSPAYREFCQAEDIAILIGQKIVNQKLKELTELANEEEEFVENQGINNTTSRDIYLQIIYENKTSQKEIPKSY